VTAAAHLFAGPGAMRERCRALDWAATPLGPVETWPVSLRTTVATLLAARHPMILFWGPERVQVYNDAYVPTLGGADRHPAALGMRAADCWTGAVWAIVGPQLDAVVGTGEATWHEDQYVPLPRHGRVEDTYWTYSYGPAYDDAGRVAGVLVVTQETTARVLAERERQTREAASAAERERLRALILRRPCPWRCSRARSTGTRSSTTRTARSAAGSATSPATPSAKRSPRSRARASTSGSTASTPPVSRGSGARPRCATTAGARGSRTPGSTCATSRCATATDA
jgi:hypothetical protein